MSTPDFKNLKTWIEIDSSAARQNIETIRSLLDKKTKLWAVVKSNAYGHGLLTFSKITNDLGIDGFCVDSVIEGVKLRDSYIRKPILVLGPTLPDLFAKALQNDIAITISNFETLKQWITSKYKPHFHLKIDTGMHRQGFYVEELLKVLQQAQSSKLPPRRARLAPRGGKAQSLLTGIYTHFASAKDINYPTYTDLQFKKFLEAIKILKDSGFENLTKHAAATGAVLINKKYHLDAARVGMGLYGYWPSKELEMQISGINFKPVLSWHVLISEIKNLKKGDFVGYDLIERVNRPTKMAVLPIGYWHGFPRALSSIGQVLISGKRAKVLGRVSMDMVVVDVTGIQCRVGDKVTIVGRQKNDEITAIETANKFDTTHYEFLTRINPLIERIVN